MNTIFLKTVRRSFWITLLAWLALFTWILWAAKVSICFPDGNGNVRFLYYVDCLKQGWNISAVAGLLAQQVECFLLLGVLFPFARARRCLNATLVFAGFIATCFEILQYVFHNGIVCFDDVILAVLGTYMGYQAFLWFCRVLPEGHQYLRTYDDNRKRGWLVYLLLVAGLFYWLSQPNGQAYLAEKVEKLPEFLDSLKDGSAFEEFTNMQDPYSEEIYDKLSDSFFNYETSVTLKIPAGVDKNMIGEQFKKVLLNNPELFWLSGGAQIRGAGMGTVAWCTLTADCVDGVKNIEQMDEVFRKEIDSIVSQASTLSTDYEKALFVHDYLVESTTYDVATYLRLDRATTLSHTAYGCLVEKKAVCSGYARAYMLLMNRLGIPCGYVSGTAQNSQGVGAHGWNYICINGEYSYVDVTWDDPVSVVGNESILRHDYFCVSAEQMALDHFAGEDQYIPEPLRLPPQ